MHPHLPLYPQGTAIQLKKFHNEVKRELIQRYSRGARRLLDLACGRGGDLNKWADAGIKEVVGIDLSPKEIEEAKRRLRELRGKRVNADFRQSDDLGLTSPILFGPAHAPAQAFDAVTCMFALHYFFASETSLRHLLTTVAANLRPGGYFFGVGPDGACVQTAISASKGRTGVKNAVFSLKPVVDGKVVDGGRVGGEEGDEGGKGLGSDAWGERRGGGRGSGDIAV